MNTKNCKKYHLKLCGYSVEFNPFLDEILCVGSSQYFGIVGNGQVRVLSVSSDTIQTISIFETQDAVLDTAWSQESQSILASCQGDGSVKIWNYWNPGTPVASFGLHQKEVQSIDWNINLPSLLLSASWDRSVKVLDISTKGCCGGEYQHNSFAFTAMWSPSKANVFASGGADGHLHVCDMKVPGGPVIDFEAVFGCEILSIDWNKYDQNNILIGSTDSSIRSWDLRMMSHPLVVLYGHDLAVRRLKCHPFSGKIMASASYDTKVIMWDIESGVILEEFKNHTGKK
eukprot:GHVL01042980.1.p1 GENE.GHVL01042980.1~~GHVL01042980.1.p1  ORF type:complete len:286 (+),score=53.35 GHVL01042980.1:36-893(+)